MSGLPEAARGYLDEVLDWDHKGVDKDLNQIALYLTDWEENLSTGLEIPYHDIDALKDKYSQKPVLLRYAAREKGFFKGRDHISGLVIELSKLSYR